MSERGLPGKRQGQRERRAFGARLHSSGRWLVFVWGLFALTVRAGEPIFGTDPAYLVKTWETDDGLPENSATAIAQTPDGYIWFGTFKGLVRFNGVEFEVFNPANTPELPSDGIVNLHVDRRGRLWVSTYGGLVVRDGWKWRQLHKEDGWAGDYVRTFAERANGDMLMTAFNGKLFEFSEGRIAELPSPPGERGQGYMGGVDEEGHWWAVQNTFIGRLEAGRWVSIVRPPDLPRDAVGCAPARDGGMWVILGKDLLKRRRGVEVNHLTLPERPGSVWSVAEDSAGAVWIATYDKGVCRVTMDGSMKRWNAANGGADRGRCIFEDHEKNLWVGTSGDGLTRFSLRRFQYFDLEGGRRGQLVQSVWPDPSGGLWAGTYGHGLFHWSEASVTNVALPGPEGSGAYVKSVLTDRTGRLWVGTSDDALWVMDKDGFHHFASSETGGHNVQALFEDSRGRVWVSGGAGIAVFDTNGSHGFTPDHGVPVSTINAFSEDSSGAIWLSNDRGVFRREREENFVEVKDADGQPVRGIDCLKSDPDGSMWLGSTDRGLLRWKDGKVAGVDPQTTFPARAIHGLVEDNAGFFWMTSDRLIVRARHSDLSAVVDGRTNGFAFQVFDGADGLPNADFTSDRQPLCARDAQGRLWFATTKGVVMTEPAELRFNDVPPPVQIEKIAFYQPAPSARNPAPARRANGEETEGHLLAPFTGPLSVPAGTRRVVIHFSALSFVAPEKMRFQIRLDNRDGDWREPSDRRFASFYDLPPRDYVFHVRAANNDGVWNETGASLAFTVQPWLWQTVWFRGGALAALAGLGGLAGWWRSHVRHRRAVQELERQRQQQLELAHIGRVAVMGELASSLAHELNQPLGAILRNTEAAELFLKDPSPDLDELGAILADIRQDNQRAGAVIDRIRSMLKRGEVDRSLLDIERVVGEVISLVRGDADSRQVRLTLEPVLTLPQVPGDRIQLQQVLLNLLLNAMDAVKDCAPEGRQVTVRVRATGAQVEVAVRDSGHGIPADKAAHIFEPFFTTKPNGLGMGLAISRGIVQAHGGRLWAENNPEGGATFTFSLPGAGGGAVNSNQ